MSQGLPYIPIISSLHIEWRYTTKRGLLSPVTFHNITNRVIGSDFYVRSHESGKIVHFKRFSLQPDIWQYMWKEDENTPREFDLSGWTIDVPWEEKVSEDYKPLGSY